ncbi:MAG: hybrid sensor histidine kinase/response regulator [Bacteroidota bacterium]
MENVENLTGSTVLVVDDNPANLGLLSSYLKRHGLDVVVSESAESALELLLQNEVDLILLDIMMPVKDGFEFAKDLKKEAKTKDIPIIFLSALKTTSKKLEGFEIGGVDFITKPFNHQEVFSRVKAHLTIQDQKKKLAALNENLTELNAQKDRFFSIMAHDLKAPVAAILGYSNIIVDEFSDLTPDELKEYSFSVNKVAKEIHDLIENLLEWSRIQTNRVQADPQHIFVTDIVKKTIDLLNASASNKGVELADHIPPNLKVYADGNMIFTILRNLISNAIKFSNSGQTISIVSEDKDKFISISIKDQGIGMSLDDVSKLFRTDVKHSTTGTAEEKGTGLGLILCKDLIEINSGNIYVESEKDRGTSFTITLPKEK